MEESDFEEREPITKVEGKTRIIDKETEWEMFCRIEKEYLEEKEANERDILLAE